MPVTNAQYKVFVEAAGHPPPQHGQGGKIPQEKESHPVVWVTWRDAQAFCRWAGVRLPSEAEWEKAARSTDGRLWPWGNAPPTKAHGNFNGHPNDTTPVGTYPLGASPYGVLDMAGNTLEWTSSLDKGYPYQADHSHEAPESDGNRAFHGGAFSPRGYCVRCAYRAFSYLLRVGGDVGFRVVVGSSPGFWSLSAGRRPSRCGRFAPTLLFSENLGDKTRAAVAYRVGPSCEFAANKKPAVRSPESGLFRYAQPA
ncbi:MAG TPA: SUMF1/EgtB/PvdO family nonheme iron enzyme, partial [Caldilineaceae bacterium]|nr:SUMF1/EgtB/PvdO family nonheme iron enzyme [Caldilineaceae bacterium]